MDTERTTVLGGPGRSAAETDAGVLVAAAEMDRRLGMMATAGVSRSVDLPDPPVRLRLLVLNRGGDGATGGWVAGGPASAALSRLIRDGRRAGVIAALISRS